MAMAKSRKIAVEFFEQRWVQDWMFEGKSAFVLFYIYLFTACRNNIGVWETNYREWNFRFQFDPPLDDEVLAKMYGDRIKRVKGHDDKIILTDFIAYQTSGWGAMQQARVDEDLAALGLSRADIAEFVSHLPQMELGLDIPKTKEQEAKERKYCIPPNRDWVVEYFTKSGFDDLEADKFLNYWESVGWRRGSRKVIDWEATARTWVSNIGGFSPVRGSIKPKAATLTSAPSGKGRKW